tara:strand:- start:427 stop:1080 length:654 start_codon:yes stop_codon:yes gene_type:complete
MQTIIISLGGSLIVQDKVNTSYLQQFKTLIEKHLKTKRIVLVCGGGKTARTYQEAFKDDERKDWIGIAATQLNAYFMQLLLAQHSHRTIIRDPTEKITTKSKLIIASGWKPGFTTDMDAVLLAKQLKSKQVINITNIDYVYDKDPKKSKNAKKIKELTWKDFRKLVGTHKPGMNVPFDPVASKEAQKLGLEVVITGKSIKNLDLLLQGKKGKGTIIH